MTAVLHDRAWRWHAAGASPIPVREDGSKAPIGVWKSYTARQPTSAEMRSTFTGNVGGFGLVLGVGGLECLETEDAAIEEAFVAACRAAGHGELLARVTDGYSDRGPGGGVHRIYRVAHPVANTKLASRREYSPKEAEKQAAVGRPEHDNHGQNTTQVLIETRGAGGFIICAPSGGPTLHRGKGARWLTRDDWAAGKVLHPGIAGGRDYTDVGGSPETVAAITDDERDALYAVARTLDEMPAPAAVRVWTGEKAREVRLTGSETIGDWFNARMTWGHVMHDVLGWAHGGQRGDEDLWLRPGDTNAERSAVSNHGGNDRLTIFSTAVDWAGQPAPGANYPSHDKFGVIARALHGGDFTAAARWVHDNYPDSPGNAAVLPPGYRWAKPTIEDFWACTARVEPIPAGEQPQGHPEGLRRGYVIHDDTGEPATAADVDLWIATYTRYSRPRRFGCRVQWMRQDGPQRLMKHTRALVADSIAGHVPAEKVVAAVRDAYAAAGGRDPAVVRELVAHALGSIMNAEAATR